MTPLDAYPVGGRHRERLRWFERRAGTTVGYPKPLPNGDFLVSSPKGIFKPRDLPYALSVRVNRNSKYSDGTRVHRADGSWAFAYHQENPDPGARDQEYTNRGLMRCVDDEVPVGVLVEVAPERGRTRYEVLGLALPVSWREGYFFFEGFGPDGPRKDADTYADVLLGSVLESGEASGDDAHPASPPPTDDYDARKWAMRAIVARQGQQRFRSKLLEAYDNRCAITGEDVPQVLDAAHIRPYRGPDSNTVVNGLLLRTDLHSLLDQQLVAVDPRARTLVVSKALRASSYARLHGVALREPVQTAYRPAEAGLQLAWAEFLNAERDRPDFDASAAS